MKKIVLIAFMVNLLTGLFSQTRFDGGISIGVVATQVDGDSYRGYNKSGIKAGLWVSKSLIDKTFVSVEMNYFPKGARSSVVMKQDESNFYQLILHYVEIPIIVQYNYNKYTFEAGVALNYLFSDRQEGIIIMQNQYYFNKTGFNKFDYTSFAGIGLILDNRWRISAKIGYSMWDAAREYVAPSERFYKYQFNNTLSVSLYRRLSNL